MEIYKNRFFTAKFFQDEKLMEINWLSATSLMKDEQYKECLMIINQLTREFKPNKVLTNSIEMDFIIHPTLQEWTNNVIQPVRTEIKIKKMAFVMSQNFTAQVGIEQTVEEVEHLPSIVQYFSSIEDAKTWISKDN